MESVFSASRMADKEMKFLAKYKEKKDKELKDMIEADLMAQ